MEKQSSITTISDETQIDSSTQLTDILLPNQWILYLYDKQLFKKMANKQNFQAEPYRALCTISTVNDLIYLLQLMKIKVNPASKSGKNNRPNPELSGNEINLDMNDYIIMRKGIEPIWEDPRNKCGGTFSIKVNHKRGYDIWLTFMLYIMGETLTRDMNTINGISVSYIPDKNNFNASTTDTKSNYTFLKIWDGEPDRNGEQFINILPFEIKEQIKNESVRYVSNKQKNNFNEPHIISNINKSKQNADSRPRRGGFNNYRGGKKRYN